MSGEERAGEEDLIQAPGTPEEKWASWPGLASLPELHLEGVREVLLVAAHPDDEVLGLGGTIARFAAAGVRLRLVAVTDGEASHPDSRSPLVPDLRRVRTVETERALAALGAERTEIIRLRIPDGGVAAHEERLTSRLAQLAPGADLVAAPWSGDAHPDHEAAGRATTTAGAAAGVTVLHYPIWTWHWARPGDTRVPWRRAARIPLGHDALVRKRAALDCFESQVRPLGDDPADAAILPPEEIAHFLRDHEVVLR